MAGNMYEAVKTWNPVAGACPHMCKYCWVQKLKKRFPALRKKYSGEIRLVDAKMPKTDDPIFVCSTRVLIQGH